MADKAIFFEKLDSREVKGQSKEGENFCFHPGSKNRGTGNSEVRKNGKTMEQPKEERKYRTEHGQFAPPLESATFVSAKPDSAEM